MISTVDNADQVWRWGTVSILCSVLPLALVIGEAGRVAALTTVLRTHGQKHRGSEDVGNQMNDLVAHGSRRRSTSTPEVHMNPMFKVGLKGGPPAMLHKPRRAHTLHCSDCSEEMAV